ncbi:MAG: 3-isopropylmalate dehydrogenase [Deltaproteobacteria bacterium]|nr:3-isopropylmalate dehydrogenase [Candidatus Zymogenaceae bacterium]
MTQRVHSVLLLPGDGVGVEVVRETVKVLERTADLFGFSLSFTRAPVGGEAIDQTGEPLPAETLQAARDADAVLLGAVGGPKWDDLSTDRRPEAALLGLRESLGLFANLRPAILFEELAHASTIREEVIRGIDIMVVRELNRGIYFGTPRGISGEAGRRVGINTLSYSEAEIERIARIAFQIARTRKGKVTSVDKANVLESMALWREVVVRIGGDYPDIELEHMYVDNCAMQLIRRPGEFDTILTTNLFGDILSDEAAMLTGSIGMLPSASLGGVMGDGVMFGMYEPVHGSAPDIAGTDVANPIATILSSAMMLEYSLGEEAAARAIERAVRDAVREGLRTADIATRGESIAGTSKMGDEIARRISNT